MKVSLSTDVINPVEWNETHHAWTTDDFDSRVAATGDVVGVAIIGWLAAFSGPENAMERMRQQCYNSTSND